MHTQLKQQQSHTPRATFNIQETIRALQVLETMQTPHLSATGELHAAVNSPPVWPLLSVINETQLQHQYPHAVGSCRASRQALSCLCPTHRRRRLLLLLLVMKSFSNPAFTALPAASQPAAASALLAYLQHQRLHSPAAATCHYLSCRALLPCRLAVAAAAVQLHLTACHQPPGHHHLGHLHHPLAPGPHLLLPASCATCALQESAWVQPSTAGTQAGRQACRQQHGAVNMCVDIDTSTTCMQEKRVSSSCIAFRPSTAVGVTLSRAK